MYECLIQIYFFLKKNVVSLLPLEATDLLALQKIKMPHNFKQHYVE